MQLTFSAIDEKAPGERFRRAFACGWPLYHRWWLSEGEEARPKYRACRRAIDKHMPELLGPYDAMCALVGGGDHEARFLSLYCPPPYLSGCSQAVWPGPEPLLVRNYDYSPYAFDAVYLRTQWRTGRTVMGMSDCLIGLLDGINNAGLSVSLTFGGRRIVGEGFGIPIILRYVLETCDTAAQAGKAIARIPCHMAYNVTALDRHGAHVTVMVSPGREARITNAAVATNHQASVVWRSHARATASVERERFLLERLTSHPEPADRFVAAFLRPPLYSLAFDRGFGTLYTSELWPGRGETLLRWPSGAWRFNLDDFVEDERVIHYSTERTASN